MNEIEKNNINLFGERGKQWIQSLPNIIDFLSKKWQLNNIVPVEKMSWNYVAKAYSQKHGPVCIKVSIDKNLISDEIKALEDFKGYGMIKLIDYDIALHAILLRQAIPGRSLKDIYQTHKEESIVIYANLIEALLSAPKAKTNTKKHVKDWLKAFDSVPKIKLPNDLIHKAKILSTEILEQSHNEFLLHGDLHMDNIISDQNKWIAIDPKGVIGPKEFELACFNFITKDEFSSAGNIPAIFNASVTNLSTLLKVAPYTLKALGLHLFSPWGLLDDRGQWQSRHIY